MKVLSAQFVTSAARADGIPSDGVPRIAMAGRSNVGKSSLLNALCRAKIARTSAAPGKTRLVNFYRVSLEGGPGGPGRWSLYLVDLPGYGYARGGEDAAEELAKVAESYFADSGARKFSSAPGTHRGEKGFVAGADAQLKLRAPLSATPLSATFLLIDSRHPGLRADVDAARWLADRGVEYRIVATKIDKLTRNERTKNLKELETTFSAAALPVSAVSGEGMDELWRTIARLVRAAA